MKKLLPYLTLSAVAFSPLLSFAQPSLDATDGGLFNFLDFVQDTINFALPVLVGIAVIIVIINVIKFIANADNEEERKKSTKGIIAGIVGIAVIVSIWGLVSLLVNTFGLDDNDVTDIKIPEVPEPTQNRSLWMQ